MRILLVEDNADHRELMRLALTGHDSTWQVEGVVSGEEALRQLAEGACNYFFHGFIFQFFPRGLAGVCNCFIVLWCHCFFK